MQPILIKWGKIFSIGNPTTLLYDPDMDSTNIEPNPWIEYEPALPKVSPELREKGAGIREPRAPDFTKKSFPRALKSPKLWPSIHNYDSQEQKQPKKEKRGAARETVTTI